MKTTIDTRESQGEAFDPPPELHQPETPALIDDVGVARLLRMAPATIRVQRFRRRNDLAHWLKVDAIYVGSRPRYRQRDIAAWLEACSGGGDVR